MIFVDNFEPDALEALIKQSVDTIRDSFNAKGLPDYTFIAIDGHRIGVSRKQAGEMLSSLDEVEVQLRKDLLSVDELYLLNEGVFSGTLHYGKPGTQVWHPSNDRRFLIPGHTFGTSLAKFYAWIYQLDKSGITYLPTFDWTETAQALVSMYNNSQKKEHATLQRYIKPKITPKPWNHHVETLMGIKGDASNKLELGEKRAKALIEEFGTAWMVLLQEPEDLAKVEGIGPITAKRLLEAIGRTI